MNHRLFLRVAAPALVIGLLLLGTCLASIRYIDRLQANLAEILAENVTGLQATQELEIRVRQLRFHTMIYLMDPRPARLEPVAADEASFEKALAVAHAASTSDEDRQLVGEVEAGYRQYQQEQARLRRAVAGGMGPAEFPRLADSHPVHSVVGPCQRLLALNKEKMDQTAAECQRVSREGHLAMLVLGLTGPLGGVAMGYGMARALRRSIYRLSVRVQDMAQRLDQTETAVSVAADDDIADLDRRLQQVVARIEEVAARSQQQQRDLVRAEQLSAMGLVAAGVAHEVRNPLTAIKMLVEAALRSQRPRPLGSEDVRIIHREVTQIERTVQGFLDFARPPAPQRLPCDLRAVVEQACELTRGRARQQGVELNVQASPGPLCADADRGQLGTVVVNLLLNALDAMPRGGRLDLALSGSDGAVRLAVCDSGDGIPPQMRDRLFRPFATTKPNGTGLGLSLSARILEEHGGSLAAHDRPEGGACFVVTLPAASGEPAT